MMASAAQAATPTQQAGGSTAIVPQGFHRNSANYSGPDWYNTLMNNVGDLSAMGFTHVVPAAVGFRRQAGLSAAPAEQARFQLWQRGRTDERREHVQEQGHPVDRRHRRQPPHVVNHRVGTTDWSDFTNPNWTTYTIVNNDECNRGLGNGDTGGGFSG